MDSQDISSFEQLFCMANICKYMRCEFIFKFKHDLQLEINVRDASQLGAGDCCPFGAEKIENDVYEEGTNNRRTNVWSCRCYLCPLSVYLANHLTN
jgi:hypothetical protein